MKKMTKRNLAIALTAGVMLTQMAGTASVTYADEAASQVDARQA